MFSLGIRFLLTSVASLQTQDCLSLCGNAESPAHALAWPASGCPWLIGLQTLSTPPAEYLVRSFWKLPSSLSLAVTAHFILSGQGLSRFPPVTSSVLFSSPVVWHTVLGTPLGNSPAKCIHYSGTGWYPCAGLGLLDTFPGVPSCMLLAEHTDSASGALCLLSDHGNILFFFSSSNLMPQFLPSEEGVPTPSTGLDFFFSVPS